MLEHIQDVSKLKIELSQRLSENQRFSENLLLVIKRILAPPQMLNRLPKILQSHV